MMANVIQVQERLKDISRLREAVLAARPMRHGLHTPDLEKAWLAYYEMIYAMETETLGKHIELVAAKNKASASASVKRESR